MDPTKVHTLGNKYTLLYYITLWSEQNMSEEI